VAQDASTGPAPSAVVAAGHRLEVAWTGPSPAAAPTLVFLHEGLGCVALWRDFPARLAAATGCGALVYSRWGYGASDPVTLPRPLSYMHDEARDSLPEVLERLGVTQAVLVGHSDGASIALLHAASRTAPRVRGLVLLAPHVFCEDLSVRSIAAAAEAYRSGGLRARLAKYHADVDGAFWGWNGAWLDPGFRAWNIEDVLPRVQVPALVVQGANDEYGTLAQVDAIERGVRGQVQRLVLENCGHSPQRDQPEQTLAAAAEFIRSI
jgi:pimeloyl-ACP methyl ester carboxylesterase